MSQVFGLVALVRLVVVEVLNGVEITALVIHKSAILSRVVIRICGELVHQLRDPELRRMTVEQLEVAVQYLAQLLLV